MDCHTSNICRMNKDPSPNFSFAHHLFVWCTMKQVKILVLNTCFYNCLIHCFLMDKYVSRLYKLLTNSEINANKIFMYVLFVGKYVPMNGTLYCSEAIWKRIIYNQLRWKKNNQIFKNLKAHKIVFHCYSKLILTYQNILFFFCIK